MVAPPRAIQGQRLVVHHFGDVFPRDAPKGPGGMDVAGVFKFWTGAGTAKDVSTKAPLELEFQAEKSSTEAGIDHFLEMKRAKDQWLVEVTSTLHLKTVPEFVDIQMPRLPVPRLDLMGLAPGYPLPMALPWLDARTHSGSEWPRAVFVSFSCEDDNVKLGQTDSRVWPALI